MKEQNSDLEQLKKYIAESQVIPIGKHYEVCKKFNQPLRRNLFRIEYSNRFYKYLFDNTTTAATVEKELGLKHKYVCQLKAKYEKLGLLKVVKVGICPTTKSLHVQFLSTNPDEWENLEHKIDNQPNFFKMAKKRYKKSDAILELEKLAFTEKKRNYPNQPHLVKPYFKDDKTNGLTNCVIKFVQLKGYQAERINSMGRQLDIRGQTKWIKGTSTDGTADISATIKGKSVKIEIKCKATGDNIQSEAQKKYQQAIEKAGGIYLIVRDFEGFYQWYLNFIDNG